MCGSVCASSLRAMSTRVQQLLIPSTCDDARQLAVCTGLQEMAMRLDALEKNANKENKQYRDDMRRQDPSVHLLPRMCSF
jgi:hypothetical protein